MSGVLRAHARQRAHALGEQADHEARDADPNKRHALAERRFRVRHLRHLARLWLAFANGAAS